MRRDTSYRCSAPERHPHHGGVMAKIDKLQRQASEHLEPGESVHAVVMGSYETEILGHDSVRTGILMATDLRVMFYAKKLTGYDLEVFPYSNISSIETGKGMLSHHLAFFASGNKVKMKWISVGDVPAFVASVKSRIGKQEQSTPEAHDDPATQLTKLAGLRDAGVLTEEEFKSKKEEILSRL